MIHAPVLHVTCDAPFCEYIDKALAFYNKHLAVIVSFVVVCVLWLSIVCVYPHLAFIQFRLFLVMMGISIVTGLSFLLMVWVGKREFIRKCELICSGSPTNGSAPCLQRERKRKEP
jgi:hypothetical protein